MEKKSFYTRQISNCDRRKLDLERIRKYLLANGYQEMSSPEEAEYIILMSCITTGANLNESIDTLTDLEVKSSPEAKIILGGCLPKSYTEQNDGKLLIHFNPKEGFGKLEKHLSEKTPISQISDCSVLDDAPEVLNVRIQNGCLGTCAYCAIRDAIGKSISEPLEKIVSEVRRAIDDSIKYVRLTGDDTGAHGHGIGHSIIDVIRELQPMVRPRKFIIDNLDPKYLIKRLPEFERVAEHIHHMKIPIQHFNSRILKLMRRYHDLGKIEHAIRKISSDKLHIYTHFIVGFPTETREELEEAVDKIVELPIGQYAFIPYQNNQTADSYHFKPQIQTEELRERMLLLEQKLKSRGEVTVPYLDQKTDIKEIRLRKAGYQDGRT